MARVRKTRPAETRPAAGKHPTRHPLVTIASEQVAMSNGGRGSQAVADCDDHVPTERPAKKPRLSRSTSHHMLTRSKAKTFRLFDLPPEIRIQIYSIALRSDCALNLDGFKLPALLSVCKQLRDEALPVFFAENTFTAALRSNWCVFARHWHTAEHKRFNQTGLVNLSRLLQGSDCCICKAPAPSLPDATVRFRHLELRIDCCCCSSPNEIASLLLRFHGQLKMDFTPSLTDLQTARSLGCMSGEVDKILAHIGQRVNFNGLTIQDVKDIAKCFKIEKPALLMPSC